MNSLRKKIRNNKGEVEPLFFVWGMLVVILLLWFSLDLINITWSRYTIKRETQTISRLYALTWVDSVWDPDCEEAQMSKCEYSSLTSSALGQDIVKIVESAVSNGRYSNFTVMISNNPDTTINSCSTDSAILCVQNDGTNTVVHGWGPTKVKTNLDYGTDLYITVTATVPFRFIGERLGIQDKVYTVNNKFASERFAKVK